VISEVLRAMGINYDIEPVHYEEELRKCKVNMKYVEPSGWKFLL
jgi:hypothetical protein